GGKSYCRGQGVPGSGLARVRARHRHE
ncbi:MAG: hypothetical protein EZS28_023497, partial [Streblomastix strix]